MAILRAAAMADKWTAASHWREPSGNEHSEPASGQPFHSIAIHSAGAV